MLTPRKEALAKLPEIGPGLVGATALALFASSVSTVIPVSMLVLSLALAAVLFNVWSPSPILQPGLGFASKTVLRVGIVLLGLRVSLRDLAAIGWKGLAVVAGVLVASLVGIRWAANRFRVPEPLGLLMACGYAICGQSAILAVAPLSDASEEEVAYATGMVAVFGSLSVVTLPAANILALSLDPGVFGVWVGASVHDVAQVVAAASTGGPDALLAATIIKLTRVLMLAPLLVALAIARRSTDPRHRITRLVPPFIMAFVGAVVFRSSGVLPAGFLDVVTTAEKLTLSIALVGLGSSMRIRTLIKLGGRPLVLGAIAWLLISALSLAVATSVS